MMVVLVLIFNPLMVLGHGGEEPVETTSDQEDTNTGLSMEQILAITVTIAFIFGLLLVKLLGIDNKKVILGMTLTSLIFLIADYIYMKFVLYG